MVGGLKVESRDDSDSWSRSDKFAAIAALNNQSFSGEGTRNRTLLISYLIHKIRPDRQSKIATKVSISAQKVFATARTKRATGAHVLSC